MAFIAAVSITLNDKKVKNMIFGFYEKYLDLRKALIKWGRLRE
ncbi:MAG: hypothetical protein ACM3RX_06720 [Methanococcaceae archaeon]